MLDGTEVPYSYIQMSGCFFNDPEVNADVQFNKLESSYLFCWYYTVDIKCYLLKKCDHYFLSKVERIVIFNSFLVIITSLYYIEIVVQHHFR